MLEGKILSDRFCLITCIGEGTFCTVYLALDQLTLKKVAVKVLKDGSLEQSFKKEIATLQAVSQGQGVAKILGSGVTGSHMHIVLELLYTDVLKLFHAYGSIPVAFLLRIAREVILALESVHESGYLHLDIKPDNIALKKHGRHFSCCLVDFGMSAKYMFSGTHYQLADVSDFHGNPIFASVNSLLGRRPSRRDDLESLMYMIVFLANSTLPWLKFTRGRSLGDMRLQIAEEKEKITPAMICKNLPPEFAQILTQVRMLSFYDKPNYSLYVRLVSEAGSRMGVNLETNSDWEPLIEGLEDHGESVKSGKNNSEPIPRRQQSMQHRVKSKLVQEDAATRENHRRTTKKRLTKQFEQLDRTPRSTQRHSVVISKSPILRPEDVKSLEPAEESLSTFQGRRDKSRDSTLVTATSIAITDRLRSNLQQLKRLSEQSEPN